MNINIFGSTGTIGIKTLQTLNKNFPFIKINLLVAEKNYKRLIYQTIKYRPNYISIKDTNKIDFIKKKIKKFNIKIIDYNNINNYIDNSKSDFTILAISGYQALNFLESIISNTKNLGLVNKECIVSAGHLFKYFRLKYKKLKIFPLDSEHFSLNLNFKSNDLKKYRNIYLTASGGPFFNKKNINFKNVTFKQAINHPKWKMGYKNSIDSATLANKCLEIIEAHYLFSIPFDKLKILIHPESLIHSIIDSNNNTALMNYFYPDMSIPIYNFFLLNSKFNKYNVLLNNKYNLKSNFSLNFHKINKIDFPIYKLFMKIDKSKPKNLIKFNIANEIAVEMYKNKTISYDKMPNFINNAMKIEFIYPVNTIKNIIKFHYKFVDILKGNYEK